MTDRKLASVQVIDGLYPIKDADRIVKAKVLGWIVVVPKGAYHVGDKIVYFEPDTMLPESDSRYASFMPKSCTTKTCEDLDGNEVEVTGHVIRTMKLRGVYSQGLVMSLEELGIDDFPVGTDASRQCNVFKWSEPVPVSQGQIVGPWLSGYCSKSDAPRIQTLADIYDELLDIPMDATVKVDGSSTTLMNADKIQVFSRNWELSQESSQYRVAESAGLVDCLEHSDLSAMQFELCGPGVNGNRLKLAKPKAYVFAVWKDGHKIPMSEWPEACLKNAVPTIDMSLKSTIEETLEAVDGIKSHAVDGLLDEGVVWHLHDASAKVRSVLGSNMCFKAISRKYLVKHGI